MTHTPLKPSDHRHRFPAIPEPQPTVESLVQVCNALKEAVELITDQRKRGGEAMSSPTWGDLVQMGVVTTESISALKNDRLQNKR